MMQKEIVVLGGGESGTGAAILAKMRGFSVFLSDKGSIKDTYKSLLQDHGIVFEEGAHDLERVHRAAEVIKSPGIPDASDLIVSLKEKHVPIIGEIEFACRFTNAKLIGITGTNGKTTTTLLTYHILKQSGLNVGLAGNVGKSFAYQVATQAFQYYVLEISSFQLDDMYKAKMHIAVMMNITPDHLDRYHHNLQNYIQSKFKIRQNQDRQDAFIYCSDDSLVRANLTRYPSDSTPYAFSIHQQPQRGAYVDNDQLIIHTSQTEHFQMSISTLALQGKHNWYNSMASAITASLLDIRNDVIKESLGNFEHIEHRLEPVAKVQGIEFINDSKATNVNAAWYALESMTTPVIWIAGGVDKGNDYTMLVDLIKLKVKAIVCLGKNNSPIHKAFEKFVDVIVDADSAAAAVKVSYQLGRKGDTVLLSPACASFDLFKNYEDRGNQFKQAVKEL